MPRQRRMKKMKDPRKTNKILRFQEDLKIQEKLMTLEKERIQKSCWTKKKKAP